ncbi:MAG: response regulator transcription factor [Candidatus Firestonebacteria bacterium]|nr:response regulator transcription factor [Candidatus Firestonebacteria bacterium]
MAETGAVSAADAMLEKRKAEKRILVVDDDPDIVILIKYHLESEGYHVITAYNGLEAFEQVSKFHPDLIVLDIMMPKVDGWVVCHSVKSTPGTRDIKVIILTAKTQIRSKIKGLYIMQADFYMTKPFDLEELSGNIHKLLHLDDPVAPALP